jgi:hypothetical protein
MKGRLFICVKKIALAEGQQQQTKKKYSECRCIKLISPKINTFNVSLSWPLCKGFIPIYRGEVINMKICRPWITVKGVKIYAKDRGLQAFCWEVTPEEHQDYLDKKKKEKEKE